MSRTERRRSKLESAARIGSVVAALAVVMPDPVAAGAPTAGRGSSAAKRRPRRLQRHCPLGCFAPNGYGLFDMAGNVWEYARDW
jgi:formylglycine-generating enzyme required for sulfatase activity